MAIELNRTPSRDEFVKTIRGGKDAITRLFGNYSVLVQAAGLQPLKEKKITNKIFEVSIEKHLEVYKPRIEIPRPITFNDPYPTAAIISDIHFPFFSHKVVNRFIEYVGDTKPQYVIINGDAWDMYSHAKFPRTHNQFTPREEQSLSRHMNEDFWLKIKAHSPKSQLYQMLGNHDARPLKRVMEAYPEAEDWVKNEINKLFTFQDVTTIYDPREELFLCDSVIVFHGYRSKLGEHRDYTLFNCINGHTHLGGAVFRKIRGSVIWELNSGLAGDPEAKGLTYPAQKITHWTPGFGSLDSLGPRFIPV